jgi:hypothetical protein
MLVLSQLFRQSPAKTEFLRNDYADTVPSYDRSAARRRFFWHSHCSKQTGIFDAEGAALIN